MCAKKAEEWEEMSNLAGGVGGVPWFIIDTIANIIRVPDTRGDFTRDAISIQNVGQWQKGTLVIGDFDGIGSYSTGGLFTTNPNTDIDIIGADLITNPSIYTSAGVNFITSGLATHRRFLVYHVLEIMVF